MEIHYNSRSPHIPISKMCLWPFLFFLTTSLIIWHHGWYLNSEWASQKLCPSLSFLHCAQSYKKLIQPTVNREGQNIVCECFITWNVEQFLRLDNSLPYVFLVLALFLLLLNKASYIINCMMRNYNFLSGLFESNFVWNLNLSNLRLS